MVSSYSPVKGNGTVEITGGRFQVNVANYKFDPTNWVPAATHKVERVGNYMEVSALQYTYKYIGQSRLAILLTDSILLSVMLVGNQPQVVIKKIY